MLDRILFSGLLGSLALIPLAIATPFLHYDITPKIVATLLAGAIGCLCLTRMRLSRITREDRLLLQIAGAHAAILVLCTITSLAPHISFGGGSWRRTGLVSRIAALIAVAALAALCRNRPDRWWWVLRAFSICGLLTASYAICQYFGFDPWIDSGTYQDTYWTTLRPPSTMGHATYFATFCLQVMFWALLLGSVPQNKTDRLLGFAIGSACAVALVMTGTRAGMLGAAVGFIFLLASIRRTLTSRIWLVPAASVVLFAILYLSPGGYFLRTRIHQWVTDRSGGTRLVLWQDSLSMARTRLVTGFGLDTFSLYFPSFESTRLAVAFPDSEHESPHNIVLDTLLEQGIPGVLALFGLAVMCARLGWKAMKGPRRQQAAFLLAALAAAVLAQQFTAFTLPTYVMFLLNLALLAILSPRPERASSSVAPPKQFAITAVAAALALVLLGLAVLNSVREVQLSNVDDLLREGNIAEAIKQYEDISLNPILGETPDLWYSRRLATAVQVSTAKPLESQALEDAIAAATRASLSSDERYNAYFQLAILWALTADGSKTEQNLHGAIAWAPQWYKPHGYLARVLSSSGRKEEADREEALAKTLSGGRALE